MANHFVIFLSILLSGISAWSYPTDPCESLKTCESCVRTRINPFSKFHDTCLWEVTSSGQICVKKYTPSQELTHVAFNEQGCASIPTTTTTTPPPPSSCQDQKSCEVCVETQIPVFGLRDSTRESTCLWEVTSAGQLCVEKYTPSQEISNVAFNRQGCSTIPSTTTTPAPPTCDGHNTCQSCVDAPFQTEDGHYGSCVWEVTSSGQQCVETYTPSQEISNVAFNEQGCATIPSTTTVGPPPQRDPCLVGTTCESCVSTRIKGDRNETCIWEVTSSGQLCVEKYAPSQEISNIAFDNQGCDLIERPAVTTETLIITSEPTCTCPTNTLLPAADYDQLLNEIDDDDIIVADFTYAKERQGKDELDYFGANIIERIRKMQSRNPKLATDARYEIQRVLLEKENTMQNGFSRRFYYPEQ